MKPGEREEEEEEEYMKPTLFLRICLSTLSSFDQTLVELHLHMF